MKKTLMLVVELDTESAWVDKVVMVEKKDVGFEFVDKNDKDSIDNSAEWIRNQLGNLLEV